MCIHFISESTKYNSMFYHDYIISYFIVHLFINIPSHLLLSRRPIHLPVVCFSSFEKLSPKWRAVSYGGGDIATCAYLGVELAKR